MADAPALVRSFAHFLTGCGFAPSSVYNAMEGIGREYKEAYVGPRESCLDKNEDTVML
jgi:hypothetical protein